MRIRTLCCGGPLLAVLAFAALDGCRPPRPSDAATHEGWQQDSIAYSERLGRWLHDSIVVDSLSRAVPTDSLYALYRAMLGAKVPRVYLEPILCLQNNLNWQYGMQPAARAIERMKDSLWKADERDAVRAMEARMPNADFITLDNKTCGDRGRRAPDSLSGADIQIQWPRPTPPRRP